MALFRRPNIFSHPDYGFSKSSTMDFAGPWPMYKRNTPVCCRRGNQYKSFGELGGWIGRHLKIENAVLDGEIACLDSDGRYAI